MNTSQPQTRSFRRFFCALLPVTGCALSPELPADEWRYESQGESAARTDAEVDAARQTPHDASTRGPLRDGQTAETNETSETSETGEPARLTSDASAAPRPDPDATLTPADDAAQIADEVTPTPDAPATPVDAGTAPVPVAAADASVVDAGPTLLPVEAGLPPGTCQKATDCTESCVPVGILQCCRDDGRCGCTWAPGAYCL